MTISQDLFNRAQESIPGGVNSPVRAFNGVGGTPLFITKAEGPFTFDADGNRYIDYVGSWGPMIMGHNHPAIKQAVLEAVENGLSYGAPTETEILMAEKVKELVPSIEKVRMVSSGTEATMSAIRLARGFTGRDKILKFEGCYHGHADSLLVKAGSGALTMGVPNSPGIPEDFAKHTLTVSFNNLDEVKAIFAKYADDIACIIVEPVAGNMNCIPPVPGFLEGLREVCDEYKSVLIFDEVMTGFRVAAGGAEDVLGVTPDLSTLGKIIGGGLPVGAFGGKEDIMNMISPVGPVYQAGTLSGNPLAMAAGIAALSHIKEHPELYNELENKSSYLENGFKENLKSIGKNYVMNRVGSMMCMFFTEEYVTDFNSAVKSDTELYGKYFHQMLQRGIYLAPAQFEALFVSTAHTIDDLDKTIKAHKESLETVLR